MFQDEVDTGLAHELIHAYDQCRVAKLDWDNLHHQACSEVGSTRRTLLDHLMRLHDLAIF
jgi:hypothetical protein